MGFLSSLIKIGKAALPIAAGIVGGEALAGAVTEAVDPGASPKTKAAQTALATRAVSTAQGLVPAGAAAAVAAAGGRRVRITAAGLAGAGKNFVVTTVDTFNPQGVVVKTEQISGAPFLMRRDFVIAKRVIKALRKAQAKIPKQAVRQSASSMLKEAVMDKALEAARAPLICPPKPC